MGNEVKVSVIVPVYKSEAWIARCLDSLLGQMLREVEVILVDDHGGDNSLNIARAREDERIRYVATPHNMGPAAARNVGIEAATGEYVTFCDADDWVELTMYERLYSMAQKEHADMASAEAVMDFPDGRHQVLANPQSTHVRLTMSDRRYILRHFVSNFTTTLFRREWLIAHNLRFPQSRSGEDSAFMACCYLMADSLVQLREPLYHYVIHADSISHKAHVWRGGEKHKAFAAMWRYARAKSRQKPYFFTLSWVYVKKAIVMSIVDYVKSFV